MAHLEIERKFRLEGFPALPPVRCAETEQGYLCHDPVVRIRRTHEQGADKFRLCFKGKGTLVRRELELELTAAQYAELRAMMTEPMVRKDYRTYRLPGGETLECSHVDPGESGSFWYAEVEFHSEEEARAFEPPAFLGEDVTENPEFTMSAYARRKAAQANGK